MPHFRSNKSGAIYEGKKPGKYAPHIGAKESARAAKRQAALDAKAKKAA